MSVKMLYLHWVEGTPQLCPFPGARAPQAMLISSNHTQPGPMGLSQMHPKSQPKPWSECTPMALGMWMPSKITWPSHNYHATMCHPGHSWQATFLADCY